MTTTAAGHYHDSIASFIGKQTPVRWTYQDLKILRFAARSIQANTMRKKDLDPREVSVLSVTEYHRLRSLEYRDL
jgi:hypothetical protein